MSDPSAPPTEHNPSMNKSPPPAYTEVHHSMNPHGGPPPVPYMGTSTSSDPCNQPYPQSYQYPAGQVTSSATVKNTDTTGPFYPSGPGQYPPGQFPPAPPVNSQGQPYPPLTGAYPQGGMYPQGPYAQNPYGHPTASVVVTQPTGATVIIAQNAPPDNLILSLLTCLFCFCPIGVFAVVYSWQAKCANETNDFQAAVKYGNKAKRLAITSIVFGILTFILCIIMRLIIFTPYSISSY